MALPIETVIAVSLATPSHDFRRGRIRTAPVTSGSHQIPCDHDSFDGINAVQLGRKCRIGEVGRGPEWVNS
jgi:hypothetical protein